MSHRWSRISLLSALTAIVGKDPEVTAVEAEEYVIRAKPTYDIPKAHSLQEHNDDVWRTKNRHGIRNNRKKGKRR